MTSGFEVNAETAHWLFRRQRVFKNVLTTTANDRLDISI